MKIKKDSKNFILYKDKTFIKILAFLKYRKTKNIIPFLESIKYTFLIFFLKTLLSINRFVQLFNDNSLLCVMLKV